MAKKRAVEPERVAAHVRGQARRGHGRQPPELLKRVEVPEPDDLAGQVRDALAQVLVGSGDDDTKYFRENYEENEAGDWEPKEKKA